MAYHEFGILVLGTIVVIIAFLIAYVYYKLKSRRMDLIGKGLWKREYEGENADTVLLCGLVLVAFGAAILLGWIISDETDICLRMITGTIPFFVGLSLLVYFCLSKRLFKPKKLEGES